MGNYLIAGGNSGIGQALVSELIDEGHTLSLALRDPESAPDGVSAQPFDACQSDVSLDLPEVLHGLVYCPGTISLKPFHRFTDEDFQNDWEVNFLGAVRLIREALPALKKSDQASIVLFSTVAVQTGLPFHASISAAKGAIEGLGRSLAAELAPKIRVNIIAPSLTDTPLASSLLGSPEKQEASANRHPLKRIGDAQETAKVVKMLLSEDSGYMTGQVLQLDGGLSSLKLF
ncbi:MAG: SDR family oxidoreductase [Verrucomicrobiota bacterium]